jgi:hypothetical protein
MITKIYDLNISLRKDDTAVYSPADSTYKLLDTALTLTEKGLYLGSIKGWEITNKDVQSWCMFNVPKTIDLTDKIIYRYPNLDLPRQKVDLLKDKFNIKVTRNPDKADVHVVSVKTIKNITSHSWSNHYTYNEFYSFLVSLKENKFLTEDARTKALEILALIPKDARVRFTKPYHSGSGSANHHVEFDKLGDFINNALALLDGNRIIQGRDIIIEGSPAVDLFNELHNSSIEKIYDTDVCDIIDADLAILEPEQLDDIIKMIHSGNIEDRTLALEMIANCNVNKSFDVVSNIYFWEYDWLKDTKNWNSVNVKSLRARLKMFEGNQSNSNIYSYNNYIKQLMNCNKLTKFAIEHTRKKLYASVLNSLVGKDAEVFSVKLESLELKEKYKLDE